MNMHDVLRHVHINRMIPAFRYEWNVRDRRLKLLTFDINPQKNKFFPLFTYPITISYRLSMGTKPERNSPPEIFLSGAFFPFLCFISSQPFYLKQLSRFFFSLRRRTILNLLLFRSSSGGSARAVESNLNIKKIERHSKRNNGESFGNIILWKQKAEKWRLSFPKCFNWIRFTFARDIFSLSTLLAPPREAFDFFLCSYNVFVHWGTWHYANGSLIRNVLLERNRIKFLLAASFTLCGKFSIKLEAGVPSKAVEIKTGVRVYHEYLDDKAFV